MRLLAIVLVFAFASAYRHRGGGGHGGRGHGDWGHEGDCERYCDCCPACQNGQRPRPRYRDHWCDYCCPKCEPCRQTPRPTTPEPTTAPPDDTCPCIKSSKGGSSCVVPKTEFQADTIEDALYNFIDLTTPNPMDAKPLLDDTASKDSNKKSLLSSSCSSTECKGCASVVLDKIESSLSDADELTRNQTLSFLESTRKRLNLPRGSSAKCSRMEQKEQTTTQTPDEPDAFPMISVTIEDWYKGKCNITKAPKEYSKSMKDKEKHSRKKRQYNNGYGVSAQITCDYKKGTPLGDGSGNVGFCSTCWSWRTLPDNYVPRMINEISCDADTRCMSGWGTCRAKQRPLTVMYNYGTSTSPMYQELTITTTVACECQVPSSSPLIAFITG